MQNAPVSDVLCSNGSLRIFCGMFGTHCISPVYVRADSARLDASLASWSICGRCYRGYTQNHVSWHLSARKRRKRGDAVVLWVCVSQLTGSAGHVQSKVSQGRTRGRGRRAAAPHFEISKTHLIDPMMWNILRDLPFSRNQLMSNPLEFWKVKFKIFGCRRRS
jgi:hypothetical protein